MTAAPSRAAETALVESTAEGLQERFAKICAAMTAEIMTTVNALDDAEMSRLLSASVEGNVDTIIHMLRNGIPVGRTRPATAAIEYAVRLAQRGVGEGSLRRACHIGADVLRGWIFEVLNLQDVPTEAKLRAHFRLEGFLYEYIDAMTQAVLEAHSKETVRRAESTASQVGELLGRVLAGQPVGVGTFESVTGYRMPGRHRCAIMWIADPQPGVDHTAALRGLADELAEVFGRRRLFTTVDRETAWVWFNDSSSAFPEESLVRGILGGSPRCRVAFGGACEGTGGMRESHRQATAAKRVAVISSRSEPPAIRYDSPGVAIGELLVGDMQRLRGWVEEQLQDLAEDTESAERLRATLRVFLESDRSHTRTGALLNLHRNSVKYRVDKALELCRAPDAGASADLLLALTLCEVFGPVVLRQPE